MGVNFPSAISLNSFKIIHDNFTFVDTPSIIIGRTSKSYSLDFSDKQLKHREISVLSKYKQDLCTNSWLFFSCQRCHEKSNMELAKLAGSLYDGPNKD